tara:strand:- start:422 stop:580 length:159 start_codon:yes stop_codon:yes gene_type:complete
MRVKVYLTLDIDTEEYPVPADENVGQDIQDSLEEYFYDVEGVDIRNMKAIME